MGSAPFSVSKKWRQEALPPAGVLGAEPLSLMPQHSSCEPAKRCSRAQTVDQGFSTVCKERFPYGKCSFLHITKSSLISVDSF